MAAGEVELAAVLSSEDEVDALDRWRESSWCDFFVWLRARVGMEGGDGSLGGGVSCCWSK